ncbi:MAG: hypothetical protein LUE61_03675, partial [Clostridiales bacterium]|nr:hypothetical protein [Clostridiales bacterium]
CTVCGDSYIADETAATGHTYVDGVCTVCGAKEPDSGSGWSGSDALSNLLSNIMSNFMNRLFTVFSNLFTKFW